MKKCSPQKRSGRRSVLASAVTDSDDVLVVSQAPSPSRASTAVRAATFISMSSGTASTTRPQPAKDA
jgi:hypothetical protein